MDGHSPFAVLALWCLGWGASYLFDLEIYCLDEHLWAPHVSYYGLCSCRRAACPLLKVTSYLLDGTLLGLLSFLCYCPLFLLVSFMCLSFSLIVFQELDRELGVPNLVCLYKPHLQPLLLSSSTVHMLAHSFSVPDCWFFYGTYFWTHLVSCLPL